MQKKGHNVQTKKGMQKNAKLSPLSNRILKAKQTEDRVCEHIRDLVEDKQFVTMSLLRETFKSDEITTSQLYHFMKAAKKRYGYKYLGPAYAPKMTAAHKLVSFDF